jgi:hypothetical protein
LPKRKAAKTRRGVNGAAPHLSSSGRTQTATKADSEILNSCPALPAADPDRSAPAEW